METRGSVWCGISVESALCCVHHEWGGDLSCLGRRQDDTAGAGGKTSQVLHQVCLASPATMAMTPCSLFLTACIVQFLSQRATLRVGHSPLGCKDHKASATLTRVVLLNNKIEDRGAVALAAAVKA